MVEYDWTWSISKSRLLHSCPLAFMHSNSNEVLHKHTLYNLSAVAGVAIHDSIRTEIDKWVKGEQASANDSISRAMDFTTRIWAKRSESIIEVINGYNPNPDYLDRIQDSIRSKLLHFYQILWPQFSQYSHVSHESLDRLIVEGYPVYVKVDFACKNTVGKFCIVEWKTGGSRNEMEGGVQLAVYTLWAISKYKEDLSNITPIVVGLSSSEVITFGPTEDDIEYVRNLIREDFGTVNSYKKRDFFPALPEPRKCPSCMFLGICEEGKSTLNAE